MLNKVASATDGSKAADHTLPFLQKLLGDGHREVMVIYVTERTLPHKGAGMDGGLPLSPDEDDLRTKIKRQVSVLSTAGAPATLQVVSTRGGGAAHAIADSARDATVVATRGHTALAGLIVGSVTQRLPHVALCPALVLPTTSDRA
jgi:nucleotide-binding universal stress UspA family protein